MHAAFPSWLAATLLFSTLEVPKGPTGSAARGLMPESPAERRLDVLLRVMNTADAAAIRRHHTEENFTPGSLKRWPDPAYVRFWLEQLDSTGGLDYVRLERSADRTVEAWLRGRVSEDWIKVSIDVEADAPHRITGLGFHYADPPA